VKNLFHTSLLYSLHFTSDQDHMEFFLMITYSKLQGKKKKDKPNLKNPPGLY